MERVRRTPAFLASALLHGGLLALGLWALRQAPTLRMSAEPVSVSIVASAPNVSPALAAPTPSPPQAEAPAPDLALPGPEAETPTPAPAPAVAAPAPKPPPPKPAPPKPAPPKPEALNLDRLSATMPKPAKPQPRLDLDALSATLPRQAKARGQGALNLDALADSLPAGRRAGTGAKGPARPETAATARQAAGAATGLSGSELGALTAKLNRLWNPNCGVEGAGAVVIKVAMRLAPDGMLSARPQVTAQTGDAPPAVVQAAAQRAVSAVSRGAPYDEISPARLASFHDGFIVKFDAKSACAR
jgi:outer membrane biosynthesis protein TonB